MSVISFGHDKVPEGALRGVLFAILSAASFGMSGPFAKSLMDSGWSAGGTTLIRIASAATVLLLIAVAVERRLPRPSVAALLYGVVAVALVQLSFIFSLQTLSVGVTLMIQFLAPILVIGWDWLVEDRRPSRRTLCGAVFALVGAVFVVDPFTDVHVSGTGLAWAFLSTFGLAGFFVISQRSSAKSGTISFAAGGMTLGALVVALAGLVGLPIHAAATTQQLAGATVPWFLTLAGLVLASTVLPYLAGIAAIARIGATLASLVLLSEVMFGALFAWLLLDQSVSVVQAAGGLCIVGGVALAHLGGAGAVPETVVVQPVTEPARA